MIGPTEPYEDDDFIDDDFHDEDDEYFDCGIMYDGRGRLAGCGNAGSEECDFECPYRNELYRSMSAQAGHVTRKRNKDAKGKAKGAAGR